MQEHGKKAGTKEGSEKSQHRLVRSRIRYGEIVRPWLIHRRTQWFIDGLVAAGSIILAYCLRFDFALPKAYVGVMWMFAAALFILYPTVLRLTRGYRATWQFFSMEDFLGLTARVLPITAVLLLLRLFTPGKDLIPYSVAITWYGAAVGLSSLVRMLRRIEHQSLLRATQTRSRAVVLGTETTLAGAVRQLKSSAGSHLVGLVSDDLLGMKVAGVRVLGQMDDLRDIIVRHRIAIVFLSSANLKGIPEVTKVCADFNIPLRFLPSAQDVMDNHVRISKNMTVANLQLRAEEKTSKLHPAVISCLTDRVVLITGAGGSIGSELARQVSTVPYKRLLVLDQDENSIFELLNELGRKPILKPFIADIRDREAVRSIFAREQPDVVLHAAAYKHVPMMEDNPCEAVLNNVCGTTELVEAAVDFRCERFVMISTDKAVRPSSIMGASKRLAEIVVQRHALDARTAGEMQTQFACVRFGNVLGSRGSVLPVFLKQIAAGGPVTVTHADMTRYFMTIPQAVRLVLQAATLASTGDVYMLDMGDPVRIMDFAREVIECSGLVPEQDIRIEVVGTRPGEKLHEQLWNEDAHVTPTTFPSVYRVMATRVESSFPGLLAKLERAARDRRNDEVRALMQDLPIDFGTEMTDSIAAVLTPT